MHKARLIVALGDAAAVAALATVGAPAGTAQAQQELLPIAFPGAL
ncbi:MAG TPA: hypothetical protein VL358_01895 [Caulobacteraceae bacterium]|jgi:hypothetical protein|nr:hypothetical protein [Caulobacteraceae bacterium]